jgi:hypothetical protein
MATPTAGDALVETLIKWNVDTVFGLPGDGINGIIEALRARQDRIRFIQVRHEEAAAFNACGYAKWTGKLGVCLATSGPAGIHLINGLYDAKLDGQPVLAITGLQFHGLVAGSARCPAENICAPPRRNTPAAPPTRPSRRHIQVRCFWDRAFSAENASPSDRPADSSRNWSGSNRSELLLTAAQRYSGSEPFARHQ